MTSRSFYEEGTKLLTPAAFEFVLDGELKRAVRSQNFLTLVVVEASREWEGMMVTADGRPNVKLGASKNGAGLVIGGEADPTYVQVLGEGGETTLKLVNKNGAERLIKP